MSDTRRTSVLSTVWFSSADAGSACTLISGYSENCKNQRATRRWRGWSALLGAAAVTACAADTITSPQAVTDAVPSVAAPTTTALNALIAAPALLIGSSAPSKLEFNTYDGSGQVVHPDVVSFAEPWNGHKLWNVITPYPNSAVRFENPSLFAGEDGDNWEIPTGVTNPLSKTSRGYLSDPDMLFEPKSGQMWLYYREVENSRAVMGSPTHVADHVWLTRSSDAVHWTSPRRITTDSARFVVSPTIVRTADDAWRMYQIDAGKKGCSAAASNVVMRRSTDGLNWTNAATVGMVQPGFVPWHLDVEYIPSRNEYWALLAAYPAARGCTGTSLFLLTSTDGTKWTSYPTPVLAAGEIAQFATGVYRSSFVYDTDNSVTIWFSGDRTVTAGTKKAPAVLAWSAAVTHTTAVDLLARVNDKSQAIRLTVTATGATSTAPATIVP